MLQSYLCDYSNAYIVVKENITVADPNNNAYEQKFALKNNPPFISWIWKSINTHIGNTEDLGIVMPMYNFVECIKNYLKATGHLWNH